MDKIYEKEKLFQKDLFKRVVAITRLFCAYLVLNQLLKLRDKIQRDSNDASIWTDAYKIGLLQGNLGLIESFLDPDLEDIHLRGKSGEASQKQWDEDRKAKEQQEKPIIEEIEKIVEDKWGRKKETILHNEMADYVHGRLVKKYPERYDLRELILRTIRSTARKYNFLRGVPRPDFSATVVEVDVKTKHIVVKNNVEEKTFYVSRTADITKGDKKIQLADLKKGMNVSLKYRIEKGRIVARAINVTGPVRLLGKKIEKKPAEDPKK